ncbi:MAG: thioredoxin [Waddliaceae bacterium]
MKKLFSLLMAIVALPLMGSVSQVDSSQFNQATAKGIAIVDFYADWCGPCKQFAPVFESVSSEMEGKAVFLKVNADQAPDILQKHGVRALPTIIVFKNGSEFARKVGPADAETLRGYVKSASKN